MLALLFALIALCGPLAECEEIHTEHGLDADACEGEDCAFGGEFAAGGRTECYLGAREVAKAVPREGSGRLEEAFCPEVREFCVFNARRFTSDINYYLIVGTDYKVLEDYDGIPRCGFRTRLELK
ncbi:unnamed protein product [Vitrella brassicaformis CCMP3155]|uniref:Uncharacterized protein n=2 Tax=Vitrella brassicaformis TaxID=1169539 RepID=A0A0G4F8V3_VITBC|nr:unnamed protein product [Vitrella brassicaformis CCMP3155]|eukprot:CEM09002.1 unnamed protein product [Vitrella brassicaformis CCMP3155]